MNVKLFKAVPCVKQGAQAEAGAFLTLNELGRTPQQMVDPPDNRSMDLCTMVAASNS